MYSNEILNRFKKPEYAGGLRGANGTGKAGNEDCGDIVKIYILVDEEGIITNAKGEKINFKNTYIFATSNIKGNKKIGFMDSKLTYNHAFSKEFIARFNTIVEYKDITIDDINNYLKQHNHLFFWHHQPKKNKIPHIEINIIYLNLVLLIPNIYCIFYSQISILSKKIHKKRQARCLKKREATSLLQPLILLNYIYYYI